LVQRDERIDDATSGGSTVRGNEARRCGDNAVNTWAAIGMRQISLWCARLFEPRGRDVTKAPRDRIAALGRDEPASRVGGIHYSLAQPGCGWSS
jgi:hypothetical protein